MFLFGVVFVAFLGVFFCVSLSATSHIKRSTELLHLPQNDNEHHEFIIDP